MTVSSGRGGRFFDAVLPIAASLLVGFLSISYVRSAGSTAGMADLADDIQHKHRIGTPRLDANIQAAWNKAEGGCESRTERSASTVALYHLGLQNAAVDFDAWAAAVASTAKLLRHMVECSPNDGNAWGRLALVARTAVMPPADVAAYAQLSESLAPAEIGAVRTRFELWRGDARALSPTLSAVAGRDIDRFLRYANDADTDRMFKLAAPLFLTKLQASAESLDAPRKQALERTGLNEPRRDQPVGSDRLYQLPTQGPR